MSFRGLLNLDKPAGWTSRQAVNHVQRFVRPAKVGHAGTLDPLATGVLIVGVGAATRLIEYVQRMPKRYVGTFLLGRESPTEDVEGDVTELNDPPVPTIEQINAARESLIGRIEQRPPVFSALKVGGHRAYDLARKGKPVHLKPRPVTIYSLEVTAYEYPRLTLEIECGSGTYIRSLGRDLAESLGTAAVMAALQRTAIGGFTVDEAVKPDRITGENWTGHLQPALRAVESLPQIELSPDEWDEIRNGRTIAREPSGIGPGTPEIAALDPAGRLVSILVHAGEGRLGPRLNLPS